MTSRREQDTVALLQRWGTDLIALDRRRRLPNQLRFHVVGTRDLRDLFDQACNLLHYAGACHRVGRLMRLAAMEEGQWVGGIVLGSPFPNLRPRDDAFGISRYATDFATRGLESPWASENREYWDRLQLIVNQARAFVFPGFAGRGIGVRVHHLLETQGRHSWELRYGRLAGYDTLCTDPRSRLFADNGWHLVGQTKGYSRDPLASLSRRVSEGRITGVRDNAALTQQATGRRWWVWVKVLDSIR